MSEESLQGASGPGPTPPKSWVPGSAGAAGDAHSLAVALEPALIEQCEGRLSRIEWFRSTWQRGGSATGFATWSLSDGGSAEVLVKFPVGPNEHRWTTLLSGLDHDGLIDAKTWASPNLLSLPTPRVMAAGHVLGGYDLAWIVLERLDGHTLASGWDEACVHELIGAAARLHQCAAAVERPAKPPASPDWVKILSRARDVCKAGDIAEGQRWNEAVKRVHKGLEKLAAKWAGRPINAWCHGDLHPGNAMHRKGVGAGSANGAAGAYVKKKGEKSEATPQPPPSGRGSGAACILIDLAFIHAGHWIEDAVYLERQFWGRPELLFKVQPVAALAKARQALGLISNDDPERYANIRRALMAACVPAFLSREGNARYVHAALEMLERIGPQVVK